MFIRNKTTLLGLHIEELGNTSNTNNSDNNNNNKKKKLFSSIDSITRTYTR